MIPNEHTNTDILEPEELKIQDISVPIAWTPAIKRPAADGNFTGGNSGGANSAGQLKDRAGPSNEHDDEDEDEENPPVVIDKSTKSSFTWELAGLNGKSRECMGSTCGLSSEEELDRSSPSEERSTGD
jgi:hypothetical protein